MKLQSLEKKIVSWPVYHALQQNQNLLKHITTSLHAFDSTIRNNLNVLKIRATATSDRISCEGTGQALDVNIKTEKPMLSFSSQTIVSFNFWNLL